MILGCPNCQTRFAVDAAELGPDGRRVRCSLCAHLWHASPPASGGEPERGAAASRGRPEAAPGSRPGAGKLRGAGTTWIILIGALAAIVAGLWFGREHVVRAIPEAADIYARAGIDVPAPSGGDR